MNKKTSTEREQHDTNLDEFGASCIQRHTGLGELWNRVALHTALLGDGVRAILQILQNVGDRGYVPGSVKDTMERGN